MKASLRALLILVLLVPLTVGLASVPAIEARDYDLTYYSRSGQMDPAGPDTGSYHVIRGGSWFTLSSRLRVSDRWYSWIS